MPDDPIEVEVVEIDDSRPAPPHDPASGSGAPLRTEPAARSFVRTITPTTPTTSSLLSWFLGVLFFFGLLLFGLFALIGFVLLLIIRSILSLFRPSSSHLSRLF